MSPAAIQYDDAGSRIHVSINHGCYVGSIARNRAGKAFFHPKNGTAPVAYGSRVMISIGRKLADLNRAESPTERA